MASIEKRKAKDGKVSYRVKVRLKGYPIQTASFDRLTDAKKWSQHTESAIREGRHFKTAEAKKHTLSDVVDRYISDVLPSKPKQIINQGQQLRWWKEQIGAYSLPDVTPAYLFSVATNLESHAVLLPLFVTWQHYLMHSLLP